MVKTKKKHHRSNILDRVSVSRHSRVLTKIGKPAIRLILGEKFMEAIRGLDEEENSPKKN